MSYQSFKWNTEDQSTPERALWCSIFLTFIEDMNHYLTLKNEALTSNKEFFDLKNKNVDYSGVASREKYIEIIEARIKQLLQGANQNYIKSAFDVLDLNHSQFVSRLKWQYENNAKVNLALFTEKEMFQFTDEQNEDDDFDYF